MLHNHILLHLIESNILLEMRGFAVEPLQVRRDAAAMALTLKLLDGKIRFELKNFVPRLIEPLRICRMVNRKSTFRCGGYLVVSRVSRVNNCTK